MGERLIKDEIEQQDMTACVISWILFCLYVQIGITYLAIVRTTLLYHSIFLLALTAFFISVIGYTQYLLSPKCVYIIKEKE